ncbi:MAG: DcrB-related protein [Candidatus Methanoperedens sp.]|nr:DcrB-related protein [Candidatus Methanoperedens sp.]
MLLSILLINGCIYNAKNENNATYGKPINFTTYTDSEFNISIEYPADWEVVQNESRISFILPKKSKDGYTTLNIQALLSIDSGGKYESTENVVSDLMQQFQEKTKNLRINYKRESILGKSKGKELNVSYTLNDVNYTQTMIIAKENNYFYALTYFSPSAQYEEYTYTYIRAKNSFNSIGTKI